jgi:hypothetical protein
MDMESTSQKRAKRIVLHGPKPENASKEGVAAGSRAGGEYVYLLSPAFSGGRRAQMLLNAEAPFELARRLRTGGISLGEAFAFMSPLYFAGKLKYVSVFARQMGKIPGALIITPCRGLLAPEAVVNVEELREICGERIVAKNPKYRDPLERDLRALSEAIGTPWRVVLLGSIATKKYIPVLLETLGERLLVPREFVGMGNMQRGALMMRCSREKARLEYVGVREALKRQ